MPNQIRFDAKARAFARQTGLDKLGQEKLKQLDKNGDGVVTLTDARRVAKEAGLDKDGVLSRDDRKNLDAVLGGKASSTTQTGGARGPSSALSALSARSGAKTLHDSYLQAFVKPMGTGLHLELSGEKKANGDRVEHKLTISGLDAAAVDLEIYSAHGQTGMPNSSGGGHKNAVGAGFLAAIADKKQGVVLVDVSAVDFLNGKTPTTKVAFSREDLAANPVIKAAAKKAGLEGKLTVDVKDIWLSSAFQDKTVNTLAFEVKVTDKNGKSRKLELSTYLDGDLSKSLSKVKADELEIGIERSWGWLLPPSAKKDDPKPSNTGGSRDDGGSVGGGSESGGGNGFRGLGGGGSTSNDIGGGGE